jgi:hypothetical protein
MKRFSVLLMACAALLTSASAHAVSRALVATSHQHTGFVDAGSPVAMFPSTFGLSNFFDGEYSEYTSGGTTYAFGGAGDGSTYGFTVNADRTSYVPISQSGGSAIAIIGPAGGTTAPDSAYAAFSGSVPDPAHPGSLLWIGHGENHSQWAPSVDAVTSIVLYSQSGVGYAGTVIRQGAVITSSAAVPVSPPTITICGAALPSLVQTGGYNYVFAMDFLDGATSNHVIFAARSPITSGMVAGSWLKLSGGTWSTPGVGGAEDSLVTLPAQGVCCPTVVYSAGLSKWVMVFGGATAWWYATSSDLTHWSTATVLFDYGGPGSGYYTPIATILSPNVPFGQTGQIVQLMYSAFSGSPPVPYLRNLTLQ